MDNKELAIKFAKENGYDGAKYSGEWRGNEVYEPTYDGDGISYVGAPLVILIRDGKARMSTVDECFAYLDLQIRGDYGE